MESTSNPFRGAFWTLLMRWSDRLLGFVSTLILARILLPDDFGVFALASIVVGMADVLLDLGVHVALLQHPNPRREDYDTAWTLRILQSAAAAAVLVLLAHPLAHALAEPRLAVLLPALALSLLVGSAENIGIVDFQRTQRFDRDFRFFFGKRLAGFVVTLAAALILESYWALLIGTLATRITGIALSYAMHPFRPRLSMKHASSMWSFSKWVLLQNIGLYLEQRLDKLILGKRESAAVVGAYALADEIAAIPGTELMAPLNRALFPALVAKLPNPRQVREAFFLALSVQCLVGFPAAVGLALVAEPLVKVLLGPAWLQAIPILQWLALTGVVASLTSSGRYLLLAAGKVRILAAASWMQVGLFTLVIGAMWGPPIAAADIALLRLVMTAVAGSLLVGFAFRSFPALRLSEFGRAIVRPTLATLAMAIAITSLQPVLPAAAALALLILVAVGAAAYGAAVVAMWIAGGRPSGPEQYALTWAAGWLSRRTS